MNTPYSPRIPYGEADFRRIRLKRWLYVDKTGFLRALENERYAFLIRPRRFGKSCWISLLENYYSRQRRDEFEAVFRGTDIGQRPTEDRHRYVVLRFDFSEFDDTLDTLRERFEGYCEIVLRHALRRNRDLFGEDAIQDILSHPSIDGKLSELFAYTSDRDIPLFVLIDEYDNFANTILASRGAEAYRSFTHGGGFYRNFFATLKAGAGKSGGLERLFVTGVSPITLDDVTSGFNIGANVSLRHEFNAVLGFTEEEVRHLLEMYRDCGAFNQDVDAALDVMREWYDGYRFAKRAERTIYNTDMVLYFLRESVPNKPLPDDLIDTNVRIDYGKLRHLLLVNQRVGTNARRLNGNFDLLRHIVGEGGADGDVQVSFPLDRLDHRENFLSLLHYFGLLSIREVVNGTSRLAIPNQTVRRLLYGHLRDAYDDVGVLSVDMLTFAGLLRRMATRLRVSARRSCQADRRAGLPRRRKGAPRLPRRLSRGDAPFRAPHRTGTQQGFRGPVPGAARRPIPGLTTRLPDRDQILETKCCGGRKRHPGRGSHRHGTVGTLLGGRTLGASVSVGGFSGCRDRVPRLGDGVLRRPTAATIVTLSSAIWMTVRTPPA